MNAPRHITSPPWQWTPTNQQTRQDKTNIGCPMRWWIRPLIGAGGGETTPPATLKKIKRTSQRVVCTQHLLVCQTGVRYNPTMWPLARQNGQLKNDIPCLNNISHHIYVFFRRQKAWRFKNVVMESPYCTIFHSWCFSHKTSSTLWWKYIKTENVVSVGFYRNISFPG